MPDLHDMDPDASYLREQQQEEEQRDPVNETVQGIDPKAVDAVETVYWAWERFTAATKPLTQADALVELSNAMSDLASWIPGYDPETGEVAEHA